MHAALCLRTRAAFRTCVIMVAGSINFSSGAALNGFPPPPPPPPPLAGPGYSQRPRALCLGWTTAAASRMVSYRSPSRENLTRYRDHHD